MERQYFFTSDRLGFREWTDEDIPLMAAINADPVVMEFFPQVKSYEETEEFVQRMQHQMTERNYCYFATDCLADRRFIGFIGLGYQEFPAAFTPCTDIGWRLAKSAWGNGYATEGAGRCLQYAFQELRLQEIVAMAPRINTRSEHVMQKTGMKKVEDFIHPLLQNDERLKDCVLYKKSIKAQ